MENIDDILDQIGGLGKFQVLVILGLDASYMLMGWSLMQMSFAGMTPKWQCVVDGLTSAATSVYSHTPNDMNQSVPNSSFVAGGNLENVCSVNGTECKFHDFDFSERTIMNEWDLVCGNRWVKQIVTALQMAGLFIGCVGAGYLGDRWGRKKVLAYFLIHHCAFTVLSGLATSWEMFAAFRLLTGIGVGGHFVVIFPYCMEFYPVKTRILSTAVDNFSFGVMIFSGLAYLLPDWSYLYFCLAACHLPFLLACWYFPESPRWLAVHGKFQEAEKSLEQIAKVNNKQLPSVQSVLKTIREKEVKVRSSGERYSYFDLFRSPKMAYTTVAVCYVWLAINTITYGIGFAISSLPGNFYLNIFLIYTIQAPFRVLMFFLNSRISRRKMGFFMFGLNTISAAACLFNELFTPSEVKDTATRVLAIITKVNVNSSWVVIAIWGSELYPTVMRNLGFGIANTCSRIGTILAPFVINLDTMRLESYIFMTVMMLVGVLLVLPLPDTRSQALADSLVEKHAETEDLVHLEKWELHDSNVENVNTTLIINENNHNRDHV